MQKLIFNKITSPAVIPEPSNDFNFQEKGIKIFHLNVRSLLQKVDELRCTEGISNGKAAFIGITETHLTSQIDDNEVSISGYQLHRRDRPGRTGGGIVAYILNKYKCITSNRNINR